MSESKHEGDFRAKDRNAVGTHERESITACFARNLRQLRRRRGFTQERLAFLCDLSVVFLQNLEAGRRWASPDTIARLARALNVEECEFFSKDGGNEFRQMPEDVKIALLKHSQNPAWPWDVVRVILLGFESPKCPYGRSDV